MIAPFSPIAELAAALRRGELSCEEIAEFYLARIARYNDKLNAFVTVFAQTMLTAAKGQDLLLKAGVDLGPLQGIPLGIKDLLHWRGTPCSASSRQLPDSRSTHTAPAVTRLLQHGAVIAGKTQLVEFAFGGWGINQSAGTPWNPWDCDVHRVPGGSSSGSAVAVAAGLVPAAIGTDTGGSVRIPAALNGLVGLKPTQNRISREGCIPLSTTLDSIGPLTHTVADAELIYRSMSGDTQRLAVADTLKVAFIEPDTLGAAIDPEIVAALEKTQRRLSEAGISVTRIKLPFSWTGLSARSGEIISAEAWAWHREMMTSHRDRYNPLTAEKLLHGAAINKESFEGLLRQREQHIGLFHELMDDWDILLMPTLAITACPVDEVNEQQATLALLTRAVNYLDGCAITLPVALSSEGMPIGAQLVANYHHESQLLAMAHRLEALTGWHQQPAGWE
ncbi:amidase [Erwinia billingiae]|uniref:amidase n=1 Tax=Erwinia billingiae TaxID=182337 RepID=UPI00320A35AE